MVLEVILLFYCLRTWSWEKSADLFHSLANGRPLHNFKKSNERLYFASSISWHTLAFPHTYVSHGFLGIGSMILRGASVLTDDLNLVIPTSFFPCIKKYSCWPWWFGCETAMENVLGSLRIFNGTFKTTFQALSWICAMKYQQQKAHNSTPYQRCRICHAFACNRTISHMSPKTSLSRVVQDPLTSIYINVLICSNIYMQGCTLLEKLTIEATIQHAKNEVE